MKKAAVSQPILQLLVSIYNKSIQTYYHFPEVILCGRQRIEPEDFAQLLLHDFLTVYSADSFGKNYCLSKKGEAFLFESSFRRRHKMMYLPATQGRLPFSQAFA